MPKFRSESKKIWRFNQQHSTINQPVTEAINQRQHNRNKRKVVDYLEISKPPQFRQSLCIQHQLKQSLSPIQPLKTFSDYKKQISRLQIKCIDLNCQIMDDAISVLSFGGYSVNSKYNRSNEIVHNHRKMNKQTSYEFIQGEMPYLEVAESSIQEEDHLLTGKNQSKLKNHYWKKSSFAPLFFTKIDNLHQLQRQALHHQKRQKEFLEIYEKNRQKQIEAQQSKHTKNYSTYFGKKSLKKIKSIEQGENVQQSIQHSQSNPVLRNVKMMTRKQQRILNPDGFQISKVAQPVNKQCYPCKKKFDNYKQHVESKQHKQNVKKALGSSYFVDEINYFEGMKKKQIDSEEHKMLQDFANYLEKIVDSNDQYILKKHQQLQINLKEVKRQIQRWFHM